ncbi:MAG: hypothetical protein ACO3JL_03845 [Myxococcota bacterium]
MLEPITLGQGRTHCPGLAADERGVVMGRSLMLLFGDIERVVGFLRSYSREASLDEVAPTLRIEETTSERGGREVMMLFSISGSYAADRAAAAARMHKGRVFTGSEPHFVPYRDRRSPLGYDVGDMETLVSDPVDFVLYGDAGADRRRKGRALQLKELLKSLSPRPLTAAERDEERNPVLIVRVEHGLSKELCRYLWSRQVSASVRTAQSTGTSLFSTRAREVQLVRCENLPHHVAKLLSSTPGMDLFVPVHEHLLVQWGYRHPVALESCGSLFDDNELLLFYGPPRKVESLLAGDDGVSIKDLVDVHMHGPAGEIERPVSVECTPIDALHVELRLARLPDASAATQALLIELDRLPWVARLLYTLPAAILRSYEAVIADPYLVIVNRRGVHGIPFGQPMTELYPQVFVPVGMQLLPRVDYELLREQLQIRPDKHLHFFPEDKPAFRLAVEQLKPLSRAIVAGEQARTAMVELEARDPLEPATAPSLTHRPQRVFALWRGTEIDAEPLHHRALDSPAPKGTLSPAAPSTTDASGELGEGHDPLASEERA